MNKELTSTKKQFDGIKALFDDREQTILEVMPDGADLKRMVGGLMMQVRVNPGLMECTGQSLLACGLTALSLGVETNPAFHHVALVPYNNKVCLNGQWKKVKEAQLMVEYRGLIVMATNSGEVAMINAYIVYDNEIRQERFSMEYGLEPNIIHKPILNTSERGNIIGAYAVALFDNGNKKFHFMSIDEIYKRRDKSQAYQYALSTKKKDSPWIEWEEEQIKKTAIRGLSSTLQLSPVKSQFNKAVALDNLADAGLSQIPYMAKEAEMSGIDVESTFNHREPDPKKTAKVNLDDIIVSDEKPEPPEETLPKEGEEVKAGGECKDHGVYYTDSCEKCQDQPAPSEEPKQTGPTEDHKQSPPHEDTSQELPPPSSEPSICEYHGPLAVGEIECSECREATAQEPDPTEADKKKTATAEKKAAKSKQDSKESPDKKRDRVADFIEENETFHKKLKPLLEKVFPDCGNIEGAYLTPVNLRNSNMIPDKDIQIVLDVLVGNEFLK